MLKSFWSSFLLDNLQKDDIPFLFFQLELIHGTRISPYQFLFWFAIFIFHILNTYCEIIGYFYLDQKRLLPLITTLCQTTLLFGCLLCHFFPESRPDYQRPGGESADSSKESPIINASFPSILTFSWFTGKKQKS